jgi:formylglycine-generating enzyme required for sulfatase activity
MPPKEAPAPLYQGTLSITVQPVDAEVSIDGRVQTMLSPITLSVEPGFHRVDVYKFNYRLKSFNILVPLGGSTAREVTLAEDLGPNAPPTAPGQVFRDCQDMVSERHVCPEMVVIPPGTFTMGADDNELPKLEAIIRRWMGRHHEEGPPHPVTIPYSFAVGRFAVTFDDWDACEADGGCRVKPFWAPWGRGRQPMMMVT